MMGTERSYEENEALETHTLASSDEHGESSPSLLKLDPGVGIWSIIVFVVLLALLKKFAWGPIVTSIDEREKTIRDSLDKAKEAQNESRRIADQQNKVLSEAKTEAAEIIQNAKNVAEEIAQKIKMDAEGEKTRIVESGFHEIESMKKAAILEIKTQTSALAIQIAEKLIQKSLDDAAHKAYVDNLIQEYEGR